MAEVGLWEGMIRDLTGPGMFGGKVQIRLVLQPLLALLLGIRFGIRDARQGRLPFFASLFQGQGRGLPILKAGLRDALIPLCLAFIVDGILQRMILGHVRPLAAVMVGAALVFVPFVIGRGLGNRVWRMGHQRRQEP
jgi:hypothetical protein